MTEETPEPQAAKRSEDKERPASGDAGPRTAPTIRRTRLPVLHLKTPANENAVTR
jgi:hypothetical protein